MKPSEIKSYPFEGKIYPCPQTKLYDNRTVSLDILTSPDGPHVNAKVVDAVRDSAEHSLFAAARQLYGNRAKVEVVEVHWIPVFGQKAEFALEEFYPLNQTVYANYFKHYPPRRQRRLRLFRGARYDAPIDINLPTAYNYITIARAMGPSGIVAEAKYVTEEVDVPRLP